MRGRLGSRASIKDFMRGLFGSWGSGLELSMDGFRLCRVLDPGFDSQCTVADSLGLGLSMDGRYDYCGFATTRVSPSIGTRVSPSPGVDPPTPE